MPRFYLTTAIDYVNNRPHLGTAYEKVAADVIARYKRLAGFDVRFVMGNDEHSQNVFRRAAEEGLSPIAYCDRMEQEFRQAWTSLDLSFDDFIRTTEPRHAAAVTEITSRLHATGEIYQGVYKGWYCVGCEAFKQDKDLVDGRCPLHPQLEPTWLEEDNYFFRLSRYQQPLLDHFAAHPEFLQPDIRRNEILRLIEGGLDDISISRAGQAWGIPLPFDQRSVVYVWFDALVNYASAVGLGTDPALFDTWWPADLHVIGKDITRFHAVIWPAMLMAAGLPLPRRIHGHGFLTKDGQRMSKSNPGTIIDPADAARRHGADPLRLYLTKEVAFGSDGDFSWTRFEEKYNADLANNLGNLVNRVTAMAERYRQGRLTGSSGPSRFRDEIAAAVDRYQSAMDEFALDRGCQDAFRVVDAANEYIASSEPWALAKRGEEAALDEVLWASAEALRVAAVLLSPVMPQAAGTILARLDAPVRHAGELNLARDGVFQTSGRRHVLRGSALWPRLEPGGASPAAVAGVAPEAAPRRHSTIKESAVSEPESSAPRPDPPAAPAPAPATAAASAPAAASTDGRISIDDLMKIDLRVARVLAAERVPNSKKLLKLQIDLGTEQRTIVAGIAEAYDADALVGRSVAIVANLKPAKLMGIESNGMVLAASPEGGKPILVAFDQPPPPGSRVR
jgi:methionyl-tRNA synthetase